MAERAVPVQVNVQCLLTRRNPRPAAARAIAAQARELLAALRVGVLLGAVTVTS
jgi:hypothetical protein